MRTRAEPQAAADVRSIRRWLRRNRPGWEANFQTQYASARLALQRFPLRGEDIGGGVRRKLVANLPYAILYRVADDCVIIIAVANLSRAPGWWRDR